MQTLTKDQNKQVTRPSAMGRGWELFLPPSDEQEMRDLLETRAALLQAETVIRSQEERIQALQQLALTDELTGLTNRRGFIASFERELALTRRDANYGGVLVMIDLDGFKEINDRWGHQTGDAYLRTVARVLQDSVRSSDTVARLGGDEFALLLTHLDEKSGAKRLAKIETAFHKKSMMSPERIPLRASFGFAPYAGGDGAETVMQSADLRLYGHKARNKMLIAAG